MEELSYLTSLEDTAGASVGSAVDVGAVSQCIYTLVALCNKYSKLVNTIVHVTWTADQQELSLPSDPSSSLNAKFPEMQQTVQQLICIMIIINNYNCDYIIS